MSFDSREELLHLLRTEGTGRALEILDEHIATASLGEAGSAEATRALAAKAALLYMIDRDGEAADLWAQVSRQWSVLNGSDSAEALGARVEWVLATAFSGDQDSALAESTHLLTDIERVAGEDAVEAFRVREIRVRLTADLNRYPQALDMARDLRDRRLAALGPLNPDTVRSHRIVAGIASTTGDYEAALDAYRAALIALEQADGPRAVTTLDVREDVAFLLGMLGRYSDAEIAYTDLLDDLRDTPQPDLLGTILRRRIVITERGEQEGALPESTLDEVFTSSIERLATEAAADDEAVILMRQRWAARLIDTLRHPQALEQYRLLDDLISQSGTPDDILENRDRIAFTLRTIGATDEAIATFQAALDIPEISPDSRDVVRRRLAMTLTDVGRDEEAIAILRELISPEDPASQNDLAVAYIRADRYVEARRLLEPLRAQALAENTPAHRRVLGNLALIACELDQHESARNEWIHLLRSQMADIEVTDEARRQRTADADPDILTTRHNLAREHEHLGDYDRAIAEFDRLIEARTQTLGPDSAETLSSRSARAWTAFRAGQLEDAARRYRELLADRTRVFGADDPRTLDTVDSLADVERARGNTEASAAVLADSLDALGSDSAGLSGARVSLRRAILLADQRRFADALVAFRRAADTFSEAAGPTHPETLQARRGVADAVFRIGSPAEAIAEYRELLPYLDPEADPLGYSLLQGRLAQGLFQNGDIEQSMIEQRAAIDRAGAFAPDSAEALGLRSRLGRRLTILGRHEEAETIYREVARDRARVLGPTHRDTLDSRSDVAEALLARKRYWAASRAFKPLVPLMQRELGFDDRDTRRAQAKHAEALKPVLRRVFGVLILAVLLAVLVLVALFPWGNLASDAGMTTAPASVLAEAVGDVGSGT
ncbi:tetratricopeptide repeat protein [Mycetocola sp. JXN-3]|uniref:tetratricopeptide repeat protein n=1 Tax=Mycetocola sp. JXN-3 TaxID=2116510 RepID=UPI00165CFB7F|nr:tetratricopeptide repeat protein [Mycetocola sp. JXN-3]